jgi:hypothetical protein
MVARSPQSRAPEETRNDVDLEQLVAMSGDRVIETKIEGEAVYAITPTEKVKVFSGVSRAFGVSQGDLAYTSGQQLCLVNLRTHDARALLQDRSVFVAEWRPSGHSLAVLFQRDANVGVLLYTPDDNTIEIVADDHVGPGLLKWSDDGSTLSFLVTDDNGGEGYVLQHDVTDGSESGISMDEWKALEQTPLRESLPGSPDSGLNPKGGGAQDAPGIAADALGPQTSTASDPCAAPPNGTFGNDLGAGSFTSVHAKSNNSVSCVSTVCGYIGSSGSYNQGPCGRTDLGTYVGLDWQCVEYARRYYFTQLNLDLASHFTGDANTWYDHAEAMYLARYANGGSMAPAAGDIITSNYSYGHLAVVTNVQSNQINVNEQNWSENTADVDRIIPMAVSGSNYTLSGFSQNYSIQGWLRSCAPGSVNSSGLPSGYVHPAGTFVKTAGNATVYLLRGPDSQSSQVYRLGMPSVDVLRHPYNQNYSGDEFELSKDVITIADDEMNRYPNLGNVSSAYSLPSNGTYNPDGKLIKSGSEYSIISNGKRRPFASGTVFTALGYRFCNGYSDSNYNNYSLGPIVDGLPIGGSPPRGTIQAIATLNGAPWSGSVSYQFVGPSTQNGSTVPATFSSVTAGSYSFNYSSGGPSGATLNSVTPAVTQNLSGGGTITYTLNFTARPSSIAISSVTPSPLTLIQGGSAQSVTVNLTRSNYTGSITLATSTPPSGVTATYTQPGTGNSGSIKLQAASNAALVSNQTITITASGSGVSSVTSSFSLTVSPSSSIAMSGVSPNPLTIIQGGSAQSVTVNLTRSNYTGSITLASSTPPSGVTATYTQPGTGNSGSISLQAASNAALVSNQTITITASGSGVSSVTSSFSLTVSPSSSIAISSVSPSPLTLIQGGVRSL